MFLLLSIKIFFPFLLFRRNSFFIHHFIPFVSLVWLQLGLGFITRKTQTSQVYLIFKNNPNTSRKPQKKRKELRPILDCSKNAYLQQQPVDQCSSIILSSFFTASPSDCWSLMFNWNLKANERRAQKRTNTNSSKAFRFILVYLKTKTSRWKLFLIWSQIWHDFTVFFEKSIKIEQENLQFLLNPPQDV